MQDIESSYKDYLEKALKHAHDYAEDALLGFITAVQTESLYIIDELAKAGFVRLSKDFVENATKGLEAFPGSRKNMSSIFLKVVQIEGKKAEILTYFYWLMSQNGFDSSH